MMSVEEPLLAELPHGAPVMVLVDDSTLTTAVNGGLLRGLSSTSIDSSNESTSSGGGVLHSAAEVLAAAFSKSTSVHSNCDGGGSEPRGDCECTEMVTAAFSSAAEASESKTVVENRESEESESRHSASASHSWSGSEVRRAREAGVGVGAIDAAKKDVVTDATLVHDIGSVSLPLEDSCGSGEAAKKRTDEDGSEESAALLRLEEDELQKVLTASCLAGPLNPRTVRRRQRAEANEPLRVSFDEKVIVRKIKSWDPCGPTFYLPEDAGCAQQSAVATPTGSCCLTM